MTDKVAGHDGSWLSEGLGAGAGARLTCRACKAEKPFSAFYRLKTGRLRTSCKACHRESAKRYLADPKARERYNERMRLRDDYHARGIGDASDWEDACA